MPAGMADIEEPDGSVRPGLWRQDGLELDSLLLGNNNNATRDAQQIRNLLANYFVLYNKLPWQDTVLRRGFK